MKILFLHLSDAHLKSDSDIKKINTTAIVKSLAQMERFDGCIIIFSGDIANSGNKNEYKNAEYLIGQICKKIKDKYLHIKNIYTIMVPGNHDLENIVDGRDNKEIEEYYKNNEIADKYNEELKQLDNFYNFARRNFSFLNSKVIDARKIKIDQFTLKVNLINTAPFSMKGSGNRDKGLHFIPDEEWAKLDCSFNEDYTISVLHHSPEWFSGTCKETLYEKMYSKSNLIFVGHEHYSQSESTTINDKFNVDISSGVALFNTRTEHGFNALILDVEKKYLHGYKYIYNGKIYKPTQNLNNDSIVFKDNNLYEFSKEFKKELEMDINERSNEKFLDYFVFPLLQSKSMDDNKKNHSISTVEKFLEFLKHENKICLEGSSKSGKTILSKYLCMTLSKKNMCILLNEDNFGFKDNKKVIKYALENQFGESIDFDYFQQIDKEKRVLIIDNSDKIKKELLDEFMNEYSNKFKYIILLSAINWKIDIKKKAIEELSDEKVCYLQISPFYYKKRLELIEKIYSLNKSLEYDNEKIQRINDDITNQIKYFQLTPDFIHQFVDYYINFPFLQSKKETNIFSKVFEANVTYRILKNTSEENVNEILIALDFVAYYIHFNKEYPMSFDSFQESINNYNKKYDNDLNVRFVFEVAKKSNIIRETQNDFKIEFCDNNLLAYFTAIHLNRLANSSKKDDNEKCISSLQYVLDNICFGNNGDILLFLSYITSNMQILYLIIYSLENLMGEWEELNIDKKNIDYLCRVKTHIQSTLPNNKDKENRIKEKDNMEREIVEKSKGDSESLYSYDESKVNSFENKLAKSIRHLELVAKILPNFRHILEGDDKRGIIDILYSYPNRLLYFMLKDINENYDLIINDVLNKVPSAKRGKLITRGMIEKALEHQSIAYILSIYDFIASITTTSKTISDLNKYEYSNNTNYELQNLLMEEKNGKFHNFIIKAEKLYDNAELNITKQMVILIVRNFFLCHDVVIKGEAQHAIDKFFKDINKEELKLIQMKNRLEKK